MTFKTNLLKYRLNRDLISEKYEVLRVCKDGEKFKRGSMALDVPLMEKKVCAVRFDARSENGCSFYVLMEKGPGNRDLLLKTLQESEEKEKICIPPFSLSKIDDRTLLQLLFNSLGTSSNPVLRINNLTGHLYCYRSAWQRSEKKDLPIDQISCLEVLITKDMRLTFPVRTFTSGKCKNQIFFKPKHPYESYPKYIQSRFQTMARKPKGSDAEEFIQRQKYNNKYEIDFLSLKSKEDFSNTKMGVAFDIIERFNAKFGDMAHVEFDVIDDYLSIDISRRQINEEERAIKKVLAETEIHIIDLVKNDESAKFAAKTQEILKQKYDKEAFVKTTKSKDGLNICLIHEQPLYKGSVDPYGTIKDAAVQHITIDGRFKNKKGPVSSIVNELLIKHDIENGQITLYDWEKTGLDKDVVFGMKHCINEELHENIFCFMTVHPDGSFDFKVNDPSDIFDYNIYTQCQTIFSGSEDICGIIVNEKEQINVIKKTDWITIPEIDKIWNEFKLNRVHEFRSEEGREEFLNGCIDIKKFEKDGGCYYFVGTIGAGMQAKIAHAVNIRKIEPYDGAPLFFEPLLPLMNTTFVHNQRLTVVPFPFKYLREWIKMHIE